jgi:dipeptidase E
MRLVLYSGGQRPENRLLHQTLFDLCEKKKHAKLTYIPFCSDNSKTYFSRITRRYRSFGFNAFHCLPVDRVVEKADLVRALKSDVIYLAGGNTFYFLFHLKRSGLIPHLKKFAQRGGVLAGLSAGALILTPNIGLASVPRFDADENDVGLKDLEGLGLTPFEFSPHYSDNRGRNTSLLNYSKKTKLPVYASADGGGIVVEGDRFTVHGKAAVFYRGHRVLLQNV